MVDWERTGRGLVHVVDWQWTGNGLVVDWQWTGNGLVMWWWSGSAYWSVNGAYNSRICGSMSGSGGS